MDRSSSCHRTVLLAIGLLVLFTPVLLLVITLWFLSLTGDLLLGKITLLELLELYVLDLLLVAGIAFAIYRLMVRLVEHQLPASLDALETDGADETDTSGTDETRPVDSDTGE